MMSVIIFSTALTWTTAIHFNYTTPFPTPPPVHHHNKTLFEVMRLERNQESIFTYEIHRNETTEHEYQAFHGQYTIALKLSDTPSIVHLKFLTPLRLIQPSVAKTVHDDDIPRFLTPFAVSVTEDGRRHSLIVSYDDSDNSYKVKLDVVNFIFFNNSDISFVRSRGFLMREQETVLGRCEQVAKYNKFVTNQTIEYRVAKINCGTTGDYGILFQDSKLRDTISMTYDDKLLEKEQMLIADINNPNARRRIDQTQWFRFMRMQRLTTNFNIPNLKEVFLAVDDRNEDTN